MRVIVLAGAVVAFGLVLHAMHERAPAPLPVTPIATPAPPVQPVPRPVPPRVASKPKAKLPRLAPITPEPKAPKAEPHPFGYSCTTIRWATSVFSDSQIISMAAARGYKVTPAQIAAAKRECV